MKLIFNAFVKKTERELFNVSIARFHFDDGILLGVTTWDDDYYSIDELDIDEISLSNE